MQGFDTVHRGIVKLHPLADPDRAGTKHDDLLPVTGNGFVFLLIGRVQVWGFTRVFPGAGIHHLVDRHDAFLPPQVIQSLFADLPLPADPCIGETCLLGQPQHIQAAAVFLDQFFHFQDPVQPVEVEAVNIRDLLHLIGIVAAAQPFSQGKEPFVIAPLDLLEQLFLRRFRQFFPLDMIHFCFQ